MQIIPIAFAFDNNMILPACVCISSLLMNAKENTFYDIFILCSGTSLIDKKQLEVITHYYNQSCRISFKIVNNDYDTAFKIRGITTATYYRLAIPDLIHEYKKIIYTDVDIIFRMDLSSLYDTDISSYLLAATTDLNMNISKGGKDYLLNTLKLTPGEYLQAGVLLLNLERLRLSGMSSLFKRQLVNKYTFQDQDILNLTCRGSIYYLPCYYNATNYFYHYYWRQKQDLLSVYNLDDIDRTIKEGNIHYNGAKPWNEFCINYDIWWEYYRKSPVFDQKFYYDFYESKSNELDKLSLWKRIKILIRYFVYGKNK